MLREPSDVHEHVKETAHAAGYAAGVVKENVKEMGEDALGAVKDTAAAAADALKRKAADARDALKRTAHNAEDAVGDEVCQCIHRW